MVLKEFVEYNKQNWKNNIKLLFNAQTPSMEKWF